NTPIPQWQRREMQVQLRAMLRAVNTVIRKLETQLVLMKTVNQLSAATPLSQVMLLAHQEDSGKILCACQVPKDSPGLAASDWAVAVCRHLGGSAGGSALVAKGTGSSGDITEALRWAEDFGRQKKQL
ncbi:hypothetical protein GOODEAATRI_026865, partial [Goodea atripinnis]